jgi:CheY-like chemotaxis protein
MSSQPASQSIRRHFRLADVRVLLVEDDPDTRDVVAALLHQAGATVRATTTAGAALRTFQDYGCDVVVTDYSLPGTANGYQLLKEIRKQPVDAHVPVIGYSAHAEMVPPNERAGFTTYVAKPEMLEELVSIVASVVEEGR